MEQEKREIIEAINEIRKELGLEPYSLEYLEAKDLEELRKLYSVYFQMREEQRKKLKEEKPRFKLNLKVGLMLAIIVISFLLTDQFLKPFEKSKEQILPFLPISEEGKKEQILNFIVSFGYVKENNPVFILFNQGNTNITSFNVSVDGIEKNYEIVSGLFPLEPYKSLYFQLTGLCDNKTHLIEVVVQHVRTNVTLTNECETGSRI